MPGPNPGLALRFIREFHRWLLVLCWSLFAADNNDILILPGQQDAFVLTGQHWTSLAVRDNIPGIRSSGIWL